MQTGNITGLLFLAVFVVFLAVLCRKVTSQSLTAQLVLASGEAHTLHFSVCTKKTKTIVFRRGKGSAEI